MVIASYSLCSIPISIVLFTNEEASFAIPNLPALLLCCLFPAHSFETQFSGQRKRKLWLTFVLVCDQSPGDHSYNPSSDQIHYLLSNSLKGYFIAAYIYQLHLRISLVNSTAEAFYHLPQKPNESESRLVIIVSNFQRAT